MKKSKFIMVTSVAFSGVLAGCSSPNVDPCECGDLWGKKIMIGFSNLSSADADKYNDCVKVYDTNEEAVEACFDKVIKEGDY